MNQTRELPDNAAVRGMLRRVNFLVAVEGEPYERPKRSRYTDGAKVDAEALLEAGLVHAGVDIKILGTGGLKRKLTVEAHAFSTSARAAIEKAGGSVKVLGEPRKIGARRTAAKAPRPLPAEAPVAAAKPAREKKGAPPPAVEEATPPTEP